MKTKNSLRTLTSTIVSACAVILLNGQPAPAAAAESGQDWKTLAISPVANPLFFESPLIQSEIRPIFVYHNISDNFIQLRPKVAGLRDDGWTDIGFAYEKGVTSPKGLFDDRFTVDMIVRF